MQAIPDSLLRDDPHAFLRQDTDTATPRTPVPIYLIHDLPTPFCQNPWCFCQHGKRAAQSLYGRIAEGDLVLAQLTAAIQSGEDAISNTTETSQPTRTVIHVDLIPGIPEDCQLYGHSWQQITFPGEKECTLCHIRGYCPYCAVIPPPDAQPFTCTTHARKRQVSI